MVNRNKILYETVKQMLKDKGITQQDAANQLGLKVGAVGHKLNGKRKITVEELIVFARLCGVSVAELLDESTSNVLDITGNE